MKSQELELTAPSKQLAAQQPEPSISLMLQTFIEKGITADSVAAFAQLCDLKERMDSRQAEKEFATDFLALQQALPPIKATAPVMNKDGKTVRYTFAPLEDIDGILKPVAMKYGFTYSFAEGENVAQKVTKICIVTHKGGHSRQHKYTVRIGSGPPGSSESQSDGAAHSYAKRGALCDAFGIVVEKDTDAIHEDARMEGGPITQQQADTFRELCDETKTDRTKFLAHAGAATFETITTSRYADLMETLEARRKR